MKINQILKENTINPKYWPNDYILEQIEGTLDEYSDVYTRYVNTPEITPAHLLKINPKLFPTTPDWEKSIYYKNFKFPDTEEDLILVYTAYNDSAEIAVIQQQYNGETFLRIHLRKIP